MNLKHFQKEVAALTETDKAAHVQGEIDRYEETFNNLGIILLYIAKSAERLGMNMEDIAETVLIKLKGVQ